MAHPQVTIMKKTLSHKGYVSNCKRIAKEIEKNGLIVQVSDSFINHMNDIGMDKYIMGINKNLKEMRVKLKYTQWVGWNQLIFEEI